MNTSSQSFTNSLNTRTDLSYIESLITGATQQGLFSVVVPNNKIDDNMAEEIRTYGYKVFKKNSFMGENYDYVISWPESNTPSTSVSIVVHNDSNNVRITNIKVNNVDVTYSSGVDFVIYRTEVGWFTTNELGSYDISIFYECDSIGDSISVDDSDGNTQCVNSQAGIGMIASIPSIAVNSNNVIYVNIYNTTC